MPTFPHIDLATPSWDLFLLLFFVIGALLYGLSLGRDRIVVIMVSMYMGLAVVTNAPYIQQLTASFSVNNIAFKFSLFVGVFLLLFFMLSRNALIRSLETNNLGSWMHTLVFGVLHVGLLVSVGLSFLPVAGLEHFSDFTRTVFNSDAGRFAWLVAPIAAMMVFGGNGRRT
jgi:hypothetical protein